MRHRWIAALSLATVACGPSIEGDGGMERPALERATWSSGPATTRGPMAAVCIPLEEDDACLRIAVVIETSGPSSHVTGAVVGPDCSPDPEADSRVDDFEGVTSTGHGVLWMTGTAELDDGSQLELDIEAELGECEI